MRESGLILSGFFGISDFFVMFAIHAVDESNDNKDSESDDKEIDDVLKKIAVGDMSNSVGAEDVGDIKRKSGKIEAAGEEAGDRHNHIIDEGFDDGSESATNGDTDGKIDDVTAIDKLAKFFHESAFGDFFDGSRICHRDIIAYFSRQDWNRLRVFV